MSTADQTVFIEIEGNPTHPLNGTFGRRKFIERYAAELAAAGIPARVVTDHP